MRRAAVALGVFLIAATVLAQQSPPAAVAARDAPSLAGLVVGEADGVPLRRARVEVTEGSRRFDAVATDDDGRFAVEVAGTGPFTITVEKAGYASARSVVPRDAFAAPALIRLPRGAAISGVVVDEDGRPQPTMAVTVSRIGRDAQGSGLPAQVRVVADDRGEYRVGGLVRGSYEVRAGYGVTQVMTVVEGGVTRRYMVTTSAGTSSMVALPPNLLGPASPPQIVTLEGGDAVGGVQLVVSAGDPTARDPELQRILEAPGVPSPPAIAEMPRSLAGLRGRVRSESGEALAAATVRIAGAGFDQTVPTTAEGRFSLYGLRAGQYTVDASRAGYASRAYGQERAGQAGRPVSVGADDAVEVEIVLPRGPAVEGVIVDDQGEPLQGVRVRALQLQYLAGRTTAVPTGTERRTDDRGHYRLAGLLPGRYVIAAVLDGTLGSTRGRSAYAPLYFPGSPTLAGAIPLMLDADAVADLVYAPAAGARLTGRARDGAGPLVSGQARLFESRRSGIVSREPPVAAIQPDGTFTFRNVAAGEYVVQVLGDGPGRTGLFGAEVVSLAEGDAAEVVVRTSYGATIEGRITIEGEPDPQSCLVSIAEGAAVSGPCGGRAPAARLNIRLVPVAHDDRARAEPPGTFVVSGDTFYLTGLFGPTGFALQRAAGDEWFLRSLVIDGIEVADTGLDVGSAGGTIGGVELVISRHGAVVEGRVTEEAEPVADYSVVAFPAYRDQWVPRSRRMKFARARADGSFRLVGLPAGDYLVAAVDRIDGNVEGGEWQDPAVLEQLAPRAERISVNEGQARTMTLRVIRR